MELESLDIGQSRPRRVRVYPGLASLKQRRACSPLWRAPLCGIRSRNRHSVQRADLTVRYPGRPAIFGTHGAASGSFNDRPTPADLRPSRTGLSLGFSVACTAGDRSRLDQIRLEARCPRTDVSYLRMATLQRGPLVLASARPLRLGARE